MNGFLLDSDVLIDALRGLEKARRYINEGIADMFISVLTVTELYAGIRNQKEEQRVRTLLASFQKIDVTETMAQQGGVYCSRYNKSHAIGPVDAIIAATAEEEGLTLVTLNKKHYPMLKNLQVPYQKP